MANFLHKSNLKGVNNNLNYITAFCLLDVWKGIYLFENPVTFDIHSQVYNFFGGESAKNVKALVCNKINHPIVKNECQSSGPFQ